jgi:protein SCO1
MSPRFSRWPVLVSKSMTPSLRALVSHCLSVLAVLVIASTAAGPATSAGSVGLADNYRLAVWPPHAESPQFNLKDAGGRPRSLADFRGRVVVLFFGFVHCPDACPTELFKLALVMKKLGTVGDRIQVLFITLDPERDTPALLKSYVSAFDPRFVALTGTNPEIDAAAASFFVQYARVGTGADYSIDHSTSTYVIDAAGRLRLIGGLKTTAGDYAHDLAMLAAAPP